LSIPSGCICRNHLHAGDRDAVDRPDGPDYRLAISGPGGEPLGDALPLGAVELLPATHLFPGAAELPNPLDQNFENRLRLVGYAYGQRLLAPGDPLPVTLYWQPLEPRWRLHVQLALLDEAGAVRAVTTDRLDISAAQRQESAHTAAADAALEPGTYRVRLTLLDIVSGDRHNIVAEDGHLLDDELFLAPVRVQP
jgi:hypothetical protein